MRCGAARRVVMSSRVQQRFARTHSPRTRAPQAFRPPAPLWSRCTAHTDDIIHVERRPASPAARFAGVSLMTSDTPGRASVRRSEPWPIRAWPCLASTPWVVGGVLMPPAQAGQLLMVRRAFVIRWSELQRAMGTNCAHSKRGDLHCVGADVRAKRCRPDIHTEETRRHMRARSTNAQARTHTHTSARAQTHKRVRSQTH